ncbi:MAG: ribonuclease J [Rickettsiales bacterium]|jgi:ribonuclease J|nr:ribonuclease J [Rickettsiales bacterium]
MVRLKKNNNNKNENENKIERLPFLMNGLADIEDYAEYDDDKDIAIAAARGATKKKGGAKQQPEDSIAFFALGGLEHIGQNMYVYRYAGKYLVVDCGMGFLDQDVGGDDTKYSDTTWLEKHKKDVVGMIITHGHEDHVGALKYIWEKFRCPIYCTRFVAAFMTKTFDGLGIEYKADTFHIFDHNGAEFSVGPFDIETFHVTHSVPEAQMIIIKTPAGKILHTGDWTFNDAIPIENPTDFARLKEIGSDPKLLAVVCESTNPARPFRQITEVEVKETLEEIMKKAPGRVFVAGYSRSLARIDGFARAAALAGRTAAIKERSSDRAVPFVGLPEFRQIGIDLGYLGADDTQLYRDISSLPAEKQAIYLTGSQGEKFAMLTRLCRGHVKELKLQPTDTVVFSAIVIPGREQQVSFLYNKLAKMGITTKTIYDTERVHASGHAGRPEFENFWDIVHPQVVIPMHGEYISEMLVAKMAMERGGAKQMMLVHNGDVVVLRAGDEPYVAETIPTGFIVMEGETERNGNDPVLKNRKKLSTEGAVFVTLSVDKRGFLKDTPMVSSAGLFESDNTGYAKRQIQIEITKSIGDMGKAARKSEQNLRTAVEVAVKKVIRPMMGDRKSPVIYVHFIQK